MTLRTLRNWKRLDPAEPCAAPGRPCLSEAVLSEARNAVEGELDRQGWQAGEEPVFRALGGALKRATVRRVMRELKADRRRRKRLHRRKARVSVIVLARDALWSIDATHLGREPGGYEVQGEIVREVSSTRSIGISVGPAASAEEVVALLDRTAHERGSYPLVLLSDNGGAYCSGIVAAWCELHHVLHLFSLPHTPQHNGASEHGMRELKHDAELGRGVLVLNAKDVLAVLEVSRDRLDGNRLRQTRGWMTAVEADRKAPHWSVLVGREEVWMQATCAIDRALLHSTGERARRRAVREAILATLEHFSVITRTRGGRPWTAQEAEDDL